MSLGEKTLAQFKLALREFCLDCEALAEKNCSLVMTPGVSQFTAGPFRGQTLPGEEPQIITWSTSILSVDVLILHYKIHVYGLTIPSDLPILLLWHAFLDLFPTHTHMSLLLYNFVLRSSFSFHKQYSLFPLDNMSWKTSHSPNHGCFSFLTSKV